MNKLYIKDHSDKHFIVHGDTKVFRKMLRGYGGRYSRKSKGWLIPVGKREQLELEIQRINSPSPEISPQIENGRPIKLYRPNGQYEYMTLGYTRPNLIYIDKEYWDSVERYLMYKMYEGTFKADVIKTAEELEEARIKFNIIRTPYARTPKQLVSNKKLLPLTISAINNYYIRHHEDIFYRANKAKFTQSELLKCKLLGTGSRQIINRNINDLFGYVGNLLGVTLMKIREELGGAKVTPEKTNQMLIEKYSKDQEFYVVRGDADPELAAELRRLGTFQKEGEVIYGRLDTELSTGPGWLIPKTKGRQVKELLFDTYPDQKKFKLIVCKWIKKRMKWYLELAILFSSFRGRKKIGSDDILFVLKNIYGNEKVGDHADPNNNFIKNAVKFVKKHGFAISDTSVELLWNFLKEMQDELTRDVKSSQQLKEIIAQINTDILDLPITDYEGLTDRENVIVGSFNSLYKLLKKISEDDAQNCVTVVHMMVGFKHYKEIRELYSEKAKLKSKKEHSDDETLFKSRFKIKSDRTKEILDNLPELSQKCKLLFLTAVDYIMSLDADDAIKLSSRLIILSQQRKELPIEEPVVELKEEPIEEELEEAAGDVENVEDVEDVEEVEEAVGDVEEEAVGDVEEETVGDVEEEAVGDVEEEAVGDVED